MWEAASGQELLTLKGHSDGILSVAFSPDGQRIVTGSLDMTARVWEAAKGNEPLTLKGHSDDVFSVAFSPDGQRIVTGSWDGTAKVWEAASGKELLTLKGHGNEITSAVPLPRTPRDAALGFFLRPFPRTASGLSPAVRMGPPRCGRQPAAGNYLRSRGITIGLFLRPSPRTASGL